MSNNEALRQIVEISNKYGADPEYVLAGGGNTSCKDDKYLYIKGSGTSLAAITQEGFVKMSRAALAGLWSKDYSSNDEEREKQVLADLMDAREKTEYSKRPSVEVLLHDLFPQKFVVHTHPALVNGIACSLDGEAAVKELFNDRAVWVEEIKPGYVLAAAVKKKLEVYLAKTGRQADILILQNHGVFVAADTASGIDEAYACLMNLIKSKINETPDFSPAEFDREKAAAIAPAIRMLLMGDGATSVVTFITNKTVNRLIQDKESFSPLSQPFTPDHIVYCRHEFLFVPSAHSIEEQYNVLSCAIEDYKARNGFMPKVVAVEKLGVFAWGQTKSEADIAKELLLDAVKISVYTKSFGGPKFMSKELVSFICGWEVENYRKKISLSGQGNKRLNEKIAIITGSAQGFGKGIAEEMAAEGASIVVADINFELASENAKALCEKFGRGRAMAVKVNVGEEEDVNNMVIDTILEYGGLDVFVSNAGILRAGGLEEMDLKTFELMTRINYTAYFIGTKYASRPMKIQSRFNSKYYMDIIQINSKSGLSGSNKNFAYAGGKFGGIGLTQSFAMELVEYRIKVNSICPGNFFDGPLWSDPENGLFVQYLRTGKVPGAKSIEDVKKFYEAKVPLGRGCEVKDVARAIFYIIEQEYETGQAVPVTGGQNMLK
ncbi:MAG: SDR family NAD(P)-dependent oxidoreductase [Clostridia bacterium]|nr:SDR family NAD(P)-dependent oxidoreductase [Clostridia bacterium]